MPLLFAFQLFIIHYYLFIPTKAHSAEGGSGLKWTRTTDLVLIRHAL